MKNVFRRYIENNLTEEKCICEEQETQQHISPCQNHDKNIE